MKTNIILFFILLGYISSNGQSLVCINDLAVPLGISGSVELTAEDVLESYEGTFDSFSVYPFYFDCDDLPASPFTYEVTGYFDGGNSTSCMGTLNISDPVAPVAVGEIMITVSLDSNGEYVIPPIVLDDGSYDNCGGALTYMASPAILTCANASPTLVILTVSDMSGNTNQVAVDVFIEYNMLNLACNSDTQLNVYSGPTTIVPEDILEGGPYACIDQFFVNCEDADGNPVSCTFDETQVGETFTVTVTEQNSGNSCWGYTTIISEVQPYEICVTDFDGNGVKDVEITVGDITEENGCADISSAPGIQITPLLMDDQLNGVDDIDLLLIREWILGVQPFMGEQLLASDVNNNGSTTTLDLVLLQKALQNEYDFEKSWVFIDGDYDFQENVMPNNFNEYIYLENESNYDFRGIKMGDVDLSYEQLVPDEDDKVSLVVNDQVLNKGEFYNIPVTMSQIADLVVANVQFPAQTAEYRITDISCKVSSYEFNADLDIQDNVARFRWLGFAEAEFGGVSFDDEEALFTIEIEALENGILSNTFELFQISSGNKWKRYLATQGEFLKLEYTNVITVPTKEFDKSTVVSISPNPVLDNLYLSNLNESEDQIEYTIYNIVGETVLRGKLNSGHSISVSSLSEGIYMLSLEQDGIIFAPKKFIKQL